MYIFHDSKKREIRLSEERKNHLISAHPEIMNQFNKITMTLLDPDCIIRSRTDHDVELYYRLFETTPVTRKHLCVVVKSKDKDVFIITAYFTDTVKKGKILWKKR